MTEIPSQQVLTRIASRIGLTFGSASGAIGYAIGGPWMAAWLVVAFALQGCWIYWRNTRPEPPCRCHPEDYMGLHGLTCPLRRPASEGFPKAGGDRA